MTPRYEPNQGKYTVETEKVNSLPVVINTLIKMGVQEIIDRYHQPHGNWQGLSVGWLVVIWQGYILTEGEHKLVPVEEWALKHQQTLEQLTKQQLRREDFTDDRLGTVLRYLSKDKLWLEVEEELGKRLVRVYELETGEVRRLDATVGGGKYKESELFKWGRNKQGQYEMQFKLMMGVLDPMGLVLATEVVSGEQADDGLYEPIYQRIRQMLGMGGKLYVGDSKLSAVGNRVLFVLGGDYYLTPLALVGQRGKLLAELLEMARSIFYLCVCYGRRRRKLIKTAS